MLTGGERKAALASWAAHNGRRYPWRNTTDAWSLLVAEMLLRRTRADQVAGVYVRTLRRFPNPQTLARSRPATIRQMLAPLGLTHRADQLRQTAKKIVRWHNGRVPSDVTRLVELPGVGQYVAGAVAAGTGQYDAVLIDTNTVRVATRYFGVEVEAKDVRRQKVVVQAVTDLFDGPAGRMAWWTVLDLAALICLPRRPECDLCPLVAGCKTAGHQSQN